MNEKYKKQIVINNLENVKNKIDELVKMQGLLNEELQKSFLIDGEIIYFEQINTIEKNNIRMRNEVIQETIDIINNL